MKKKEKASRIANEQRRIQKNTGPGVIINPEETAAITTKGLYPAVYGSGGQWTSPNKKDTDILIRRQLLSEGKADNAVTPFGLMTAGQEVIDYLKEKKEQENYYLTTQLATYLVDPQRPETQEKAFLVAPELREVPEKQHERDLAIQEALRVMLRDGQIRGPEDHLLIMEICKDQYVLPAYPLWDPQGLIIQGLNGLDRDTFYQMTVIRGIFNPITFGTMGAPGDDAFKEAQRKVKAMILKRLYPGLKDKSVNDIIANIIEKRNSPIQTGAIDNDYYGLFNSISTGANLRGAPAITPVANNP